MQILAPNTLEETIERPPIEETEVSACWTDAQDGLAKQFGEQVWRSWLSKLVVVSDENGCLILRAPSGFVRDRVSNDYRYAIERHMGRHVEIVT